MAFSEGGYSAGGGGFEIQIRIQIRIQIHIQIQIQIRNKVETKSKPEYEPLRWFCHYKINAVTTMPMTPSPSHRLSEASRSDSSRSASGSNSEDEYSDSSSSSWERYCSDCFVMRLRSELKSVVDDTFPVHIERLCSRIERTVAAVVVATATIAYFASR